MDELETKPKKERTFAKFSEIKRQAYIDCIQRGLWRRMAAEAIGVSHATISAYVREHPEYKLLMDEAEMHANERVVNAVYEKACEGHPTLSIFWLMNRMPKVWKDMRQLQQHQQASEMTPEQAKEELKKRGLNVE